MSVARRRLDVHDPHRSTSGGRATFIDRGRERRRDITAATGGAVSSPKARPDLGRGRASKAIIPGLTTRRPRRTRSPLRARGIVGDGKYRPGAVLGARRTQRDPDEELDGSRSMLASAGGICSPGSARLGKSWTAAVLSALVAHGKRSAWPRQTQGDHKLTRRGRTAARSGHCMAARRSNGTRIVYESDRIETSPRGVPGGISRPVPATLRAPGVRRQAE